MKGFNHRGTHRLVVLVIAVIGFALPLAGLAEAFNSSGGSASVLLQGGTEWCKWDGSQWHFEGQVSDETVQEWRDAGYIVAPANPDGTCGDPVEPTATETPFPTATLVETFTETPTEPTFTPTETSTAPTETATETPTETPTGTLTETPTETPTGTLTETPTGTLTETPTKTDTPTETPTDTPTDVPTNTPTDVPTVTPTATESFDVQLLRRLIELLNLLLERLLGGGGGFGF